MSKNKDLYLRVGGIKLPTIQRVFITNETNKETDKYPKVITFDASDECYEKLLQSIDNKHIIADIEINQLTLLTVKGYEIVIPGDKIIIYDKQTIKLIKNER